MEVSAAFKSAVIVLGGSVGWYLGGWDALLRFLVILTVIDFITGSIAATVKGEAKSKVGFIGIARKVFIFVLVGIATHLDNLFGSASALREAVLFFYIANELLSVIENAGRMGVPLPPALLNAVAVLNGKAGKEDKKEG
ncbi:holin [Bacillus phage PBC1]|uniref:Holin n=1 Tax=Bacillus phage PBC1 TaxID=1161901 RepID=I1TLF5_9CAUD|nr:holin [Bacillus phage PBC1]AFE86257.1 holin [Bacillus phage PBC1]